MQPRYLAPAELVFLHIRNPIFFVEFRGIVDVEKLKNAFRTLCRRHTALRAKVAWDTQGYRVDVDPDPRDFVEIVKEIKGGEDELVAEAAHFPAHETALSRLIVVNSGGDEGLVALQINDMFFDGAGMTALMRELWQVYTDMNYGREIPDIPSESLPEAPSELAVATLSSTGPAIDHLYPTYPNHLVGRTTLSAEDTASLVMTARHSNTSIHAALAGLLLVTLRDHNIPSGDNSMWCYSLIGLKARTNSGPETEKSKAPSVYHCSQVSVPPAADPIDVGREVKRQIDCDIARQTTFGHADDVDAWSGIPYLSPWSAVIARKHTRMISINNAGLVHPFPCPPDLHITGLVLLPEIEFLPGMTKAAWPFFLSWTYADRISIKGIFPPDRFTVVEVESIIIRFKEVVQKLF